MSQTTTTATTTSPIPPPRPTLLFGNSNAVDTTNVDTTLSSSNNNSNNNSNSSMPTSPSTAVAAAAAAREADGFLPEMPQWKKDLIQRRKTNNARTTTATTSTTIGTTTTSSTMATTYSPRTPPALASNAAGYNSPNGSGGSSIGSGGSSSEQTMLDLCIPANAESTTIITTKTSHNQKYVLNKTTYLNQTPATMSPTKEKSENCLIDGYHTPQVVAIGPTKNHGITEEKSKDFSASELQNKGTAATTTTTTSATSATTPTKTTAGALPIPKQRSVLYSPTQLQQASASTTTTTITASELQILCKKSAAAATMVSVDNGRGEVETGTATTPTGALTTKVNQSHTKCETEQYKAVTTAATVSNHSDIKQQQHPLQKNPFIRNQQQQQLSQNFVKHSKYNQDKLDVSNNHYGLKLQTAIKITENINNGSRSGNSSSNGKMVAMQEMKKTSPQNGGHHHHGHHGMKRLQPQTGVGTTSNSQPTVTEATQLDSAEDLSFGPGIVSKLRCRYQSLALRESMEEQHKRRLRRSTSLNTLLDREDNDVIEVHGDESDVSAVELRKQQLQQTRPQKIDPPTGTTSVYAKKPTPLVGGGTSRYNSSNSANAVANATAASVNANGMAAGQQHSNMGQSTTGGSAEYGNGMRSRHLKRGNEIMKRARSVEALLSEKSHWSSSACAPSHAITTPTTTNYIHNTTSTIGSSSAVGAYMPTCVTIEDKISNARERLHSGTDAMPPKRLTSIIDDTERPPPDLVKQTLKKFEASANRRPRAAQRSNGTGDVANKVANYKSIIQEHKPAVVFPKPTTGSPTKKLGGGGGGGALPTPTSPKISGASMSNTVVTPSLRKANGNDAEGGVFASTPKQIVARSAALDYSTPPASRGSAAMNSNNRQNLLNDKKIEGHGVMTFDSPMSALTKMLNSTHLDSVYTSSSLGANSNNSNNNNSNHTRQQLNDNHTTNNESTNTYKSVVGGSNTATDLIGDNDEHEATIAGADDETDSDGNDDENDKGANDEVVVAAQHNMVCGGAGMAVEGGDDDDDNNDNVDGDDDDDNDNDNNDKPSVTAMPMSTSTPTPPSPPYESLQATGDTTTSREFGAAKRITKSALENIAKAGTTQEFKFIQQNNSLKTTTIATTTTITTSSSTSKLSNGCETNNVNVVPPAIINTNTAGSVAAAAGAQAVAISPTATITTPIITKQIGVIRPLINTTVTAPTTIATPALTSREIEKNRINEMKKTKAFAAESAASLSPSTSTHISNNSSLSGGGGGGGVGVDSDATNFGNSGGVNELDTAAATGSPIWALRKRRQGAASGVGPPTNDNSMVFNFSKSTKEVPDYIESDVVIFRRKRELPKPNESGFVLLGDLSVETSTDPECDDFSMCPPSPCDVEFENANVVIDGKSSIRQRQKETSFRVQFNDTLTSTFEYPSEASLAIDESSYIVDNYANVEHNLVRDFEHLRLDDEHHQLRHSHKHHHVAVDEIIQLPTTTTTTAPATTTAITNSTATAVNPTATNILGNLPLASASLGLYTPVKGSSIDNIFQLGVTRAPSSQKTATTNGGGVSIGDGVQNGGGDGVGLGLIKHIECKGGSESENNSLQYLKPADDELNIAYSDGTQKADLLY